MVTLSLLFQKTIQLIDAANSKDPRMEIIDDKKIPQELLYSHRMTEMLERFSPEASEAVKLACRAQHIQRWTSPRNSYPMTREGYLKWRTTLYKFHAEKTGELIKEAGYDNSMIERVKNIIGKKNIKSDPESQLTEDVAGLVFIEHYMLPFAVQKNDYAEEKWVHIIRKTWNKLSPEARAFAISKKIKLPKPLVPLILKAIREN